MLSPSTTIPTRPKSDDYVREHDEALNRTDFIEGRREITTQYDPGTLSVVQQHDTGRLV